MATETSPPADLSDDAAELLYEDSLRSHASLMHDTRGNEQSAHTVLRHTGVKKYDEVGPIEAAASEVILTIARA